MTTFPIHPLIFSLICYCILRVLVSIFRATFSFHPLTLFLIVSVVGLVGPLLVTSHLSCGLLVPDTMSNPVEQTHLHVDSSFGQHYFYRLEHRDHLITSPNTGYLPSPPPPDGKTTSKNNIIRWRYPRFIPDNMPHLAFLHKQPLFQGPIFRRLDVTYSNVPVIKLSNGKYMLHPDVQDSWQRLETALFGIQQLLLLESVTNWFTNLTKGDMPYQCGYQCPHKSEDDARFGAMKSRDAFVLLGALCSFAISFYRTRDQAKETIPSWHKVLMPMSYTPEWLELLEGTFLCDFTRGARVGGYIQANATRLFPQIRAFLDSNVPIWIEWDLHDITVSNPKYGSPFLPRKDRVQRAVARAHTNDHDPIYSPESSFNWVNPDKPSFYQGGIAPYDAAFEHEPDEPGMIQGNYTDPDLESDYGNLSDEDKDMDSDLEHPPSARAVSHLRPSPPAPCPSPPAPRQIIPAPPPSIPARWTQSPTNIPVVHAGSGQCAGQTYIEFFKRRHAERVAISCKESDSQFERRRDTEDMAKQGHKVRLKALFLWKVEEGLWVRTVVSRADISTVWARFPPYLRRFDYDHKEWDICPFLETPDDSEPSRDTTLEGSAPKGGVDCALDLVEAYDTTKTAVSMRMDTLKLKRLLECRYGFTVPKRYVANPPSPGKPMVLGHGEGLYVKFRLHGKTTDDLNNDEAIREMWNSIIINEVANGLPRLFDMSRQVKSPVSLVHPKLKLAIAPGPSKGATKICLIGVKDEKNTPLSKQWFLLAFKDFATVVQIFREGWTEGILHAGRELMRRGIPFNTVIVRKQRPVGSERDCLGLGHRPLGYVPKLRDYAHYESQRSKLLQEHDGVYGRVALKMGGLYWRLTIEDADKPEQLIKKAMKLRPFSRPVGQVVAQVSEEEFLVDDQLSPAAAAVLSGLYVVNTSFQNQVEHVSWWPKQDVWYKSELNVGYWSERCEDWYQQRLLDIRAGKAVMMNSRDWKISIRGKGPQVTAFKEKFSLFAQDFTQRNGNPICKDR